MTLPILTRQASAVGVTTMCRDWPRHQSAAHAACRRSSWWPVALVATVVGLFWSAVGLYLHATLRTGMDLAIFDQAIRALSHGEAPISAMKGGLNLWGDHFHPAIVVLAPPYWLWDGPETLLVAQALLVAGGCAVLTRCAQRVLPVSAHRDRNAMALGLVLAVSPGVQGAASFDFHEVSLAVPVLALALAALVEGRWGAASGWALPLLLVKEDMVLVVLGLAVVLALRGQVRRATLLAAVAPAWTAGVIWLVIPTLAGRPWSYGNRVGGGIAGLVGRLVDSLVSPFGIGTTAAVLLLTTGFVALRSPLLLAAAPLMLARGATGPGNLSMLGYHYDLMPQIIVLFAALEVLRRPLPASIRRLWSRRMLALAVLGLFVGPLCWRVVAVPVSSSRIQDAHAAIAVVPHGEAVGVDVVLAPHTSRDHRGTQLVGPSELVTEPVVADWVVLDRRTNHHGGPEWVPGRIDELRTMGFHEHARVGDFVVLRR